MAIEGVFKEGFITTSYDSVVNWAKTGSLWPMTLDRKSTRLNSSHSQQSRMPSSA